jgi:hypothetical protein
MYQNQFYETYKKNIHSQNGEDGVICKMLQILGIVNGWVCEFGAWDGKHLSNTFSLVERGFNAVFIEANENSFKDLQKTSELFPNIIPILAYVSPDTENKDSLDRILQRTEIPFDFAVLSIDIDSFDYQVWESLVHYRPKIVIIEINSGIDPNDKDWIHGENMQGTGFYPMLQLGKEKNYTFLMHTGNMIFIRNEDSHLFSIPENPITCFRRDFLSTTILADTHCNTHLITFANKSYYPAVERLKIQSQPFGFKTVTCVTDKDLKSDVAFWAYNSRFILTHSRGFGYWIWKPYIIRQRLQNLQENEILVYLDAGCELNMYGLTRFSEYIEMAKSSPGIVTFQLAHLEKTFTKNSLMQFLDCEHFSDSKQLLGGIIIMRKCKHVVDIINMWYSLAWGNYHYIDDSKSIINDPEFREHRHDQSIFSLLCKLKGSTVIKDETWCDNWLNGKKFPILAMRNSQLKSQLEF